MSWSKALLMVHKRLNFFAPAKVVDVAGMSREIALTTQPIICSYLAVVTAFYVVNAIFYRVSGDAWIVPVTSGVTAAIAAGLFLFVRRAADISRQEIAGHIVNTLLFINCFQDAILEYQPTKLIYFALVIPIYAITGARLRVVLPSTVASTGALAIFVCMHEAESAESYIWVMASALTAAFGMRAALRLALTRAAAAKLTSDAHRRNAEAMANLDVLTGLPNRRSFIQGMERQLCSGAAFDLALIDLDGFKPVNDIYGHATGDAVLIAIGARLSALCGAS
ncbi:MAG TPA: GGDEF domain-containing protein, partial [Asticcacaulis sp.]|nr:GGDEF domain-containing protein [Asticcacaulis sp.]